jgi:leucyl/phenylalanyl-tRNA--protein transferase
MTPQEDRASAHFMKDTLTIDRLLNAYAQGYFPMAEDAGDEEIYWFSPEERGVIPLDGFNIPRSVRKQFKSPSFSFTFRTNTAFEEVIRACAAPVPGTGREKTWINDEISALYCELHEQGHAHSVEVWENDKLVGGLYGVSLGGAFFGESMFSRTSGASKFALIYLVALLTESGYTLLDTQYVNNHLTQFGCVGIPKTHYLSQLEKALKITPNPSSRFCTTAESSHADARVKSMLTSPS